jgi:hypothetical protein
MQMTPNWKYLELVPKRFHKRIGLADYAFGVLNPWHRPYNYVRHPGGGAVAIAPAAYCELAAPAGTRHLLVPIAVHPAEGEAVLLIGKLLFTGSRVEKYMSLFKAYECIVATPQIDFAAVRHGLSHPGSMLKRPRTVQALERLFGTTYIDLQRPEHLKQFYVQFGLLLTATDQALQKALIRLFPKLRVLPSARDAILDWQVDGIPGIAEPIPIRHDAST